MNRQASIGQGLASVSGQIDAICDQFEAAWLSGQEPSIREFLTATLGGCVAQDGSAHHALLIELIKVTSSIASETLASASLRSNTPFGSRITLPGVQSWGRW